MRRFLPIAMLTIAAAGCGESTTYSTEEVAQAFQRHGYALVVRKLPQQTFAGRPVEVGQGDLLTPTGGDPFIVIVARSNAFVDVFWPDYESQQSENTFDVRRANVVVISDSGLAAGQRARVLAAFSSLPDRGAAVVIAGRE